jgi:hypothetical protein
MTGLALINRRELRMTVDEVTDLLVQEILQSRSMAISTIQMNRYGHGIEVGRKVLIDGKVFTVISTEPSLSKISVERVERHLTMEKPMPQKFGGDRPYLKRKKGRS